MPNFTRSELNSDVATLVSGSYTDANFNLIANQAVKRVVGEIDLRSTQRKTALSPNLFDDIFEYVCASDMKGNKVIDIQPQINRGRFERWTLTTQEEFDRKKKDNKLDRWGDPIDLKYSEGWLGDNLVAFSYDDFVRKMLISRPVDDDETSIDQLDSVGDWEAFGDGTNLTKDASNYVKGSASINWDINADGGTTAGIYNDSLDDFDVSDYKTAGSVFVWAYLSDSDDVTNFILRIGSDSSNYYYITITTNNEGVSFYDGWNLLRFDFSNKSTTGTPDDDACDYIALYMTKDAGKTSETDYRFDHIIMKIGNHYNVKYYSKYGWQSSAGTYLEDSTADTDLLNADTDEYELFKIKTCELTELHLGNRGEADRFRQDYEALKAQYMMDNPSEALTLTQTYHEI